MSREKQIEEMARDIDEVSEFTILGLNDAFIKVKVACEKVAERLYNAGYRKQSEGEWEHINGNEHICKNCSEIFYGFVDDFNFCPNCGAKMSGKEGEGE